MVTQTASHSPKTILQALAFSCLALGALATGLGVTTWSVAKANELIFGAPAITCTAE